MRRFGMRKFLHFLICGMVCMLLASSCGDKDKDKDEDLRRPNRPQVDPPSPDNGDKDDDDKKDDGDEALKYPDDMAESLLDTSMRCSIGNVKIAYDAPGNMFICGENGRRLTAIALSTGTAVEINSPYGFIKNGVDLSEATLDVNGESVAITYMKVMKSDASTLWLLARCADTRFVWFVVDKSLFAQ